MKRLLLLFALAACSSDARTLTAPPPVHTPTFVWFAIDGTYMSADSTLVVHIHDNAPAGDYGDGHMADGTPFSFVVAPVTNPSGYGVTYVGTISREQAPDMQVQFGDKAPPSMVITFDGAPVFAQQLVVCTSRAVCR